MIPKTRTPEEVDALFSSLADWLCAGKTLAAFCRQPGKPSRQTIQDLMRGDERLTAIYQKARAVGYEVLADDILDIADTPSIAAALAQVDDIGHRKLQLWAREKLLTVWNAAVWGTKPAPQSTTAPVNVYTGVPENTE